jgi:hypothetical protein
VAVDIITQSRELFGYSPPLLAVMLSVTTFLFLDEYGDIMWCLINFLLSVLSQRGYTQQLAPIQEVKNF